MVDSTVSPEEDAVAVVASNNGFSHGIMMGYGLHGHGHGLCEMWKK